MTTMTATTATTEINDEVRSKVRAILGDHEYLKNSYFHRPQCNAAGRRSNEKRYNGDEINFTFDGKEFSLKRNYSESCNHVYYSLVVHVNGVKKDVRALKALIK